jgi:DNA repair exonuclease SbcCD ATPase subunit
MKKAVSLLIMMIIALGYTYAQTEEELQTQINAHKNEKTELEKQIKDLQGQLNTVTTKINELEIQLSKMNGDVETGSSGIICKTTETGSALREKPNAIAAEITFIPGGAEIVVEREYKGLYFKTTYNGKSGWISYSNIASNPKLDNMVMSLTDKEIDNKKLEKLTKLYGKEIANKIVLGLLWEGMSQGMVIESIGRPDNTTRDQTSTGVREEWEYSDKKLIFSNGELQKWISNF